MAIDVKNFITQARQKGVPDEQTYNYLQSKNLIPTGNQPGQEIQQPKPSIGGFVGNIFKSAGNLVGGIAQSVMHPIKTVEGIGKVALGGASEIPGVDQVFNSVVGQKNLQTSRDSFNNVVKFYGQRYGGSNAQEVVNNIAKTAYSDPVGFALDASILFDLGAGALGKAGEISKVAEIGQAGEVLGKVGEAINPLNIAGKTLGKAGELALGNDFIKTLPQKLEQINLRLTPTQKLNLGNKLTSVTDFISQTLKPGTPTGRFEQINTIWNDSEKVLQDALKSPEAQNMFVSKTNVIDQLNQLKSYLSKDSPDADAIGRQIDSAVENIKKQYIDEKIPVDRLNTLKRLTFKNAYNKAGTKVLSGVEFGIGDVLRQSLYDATKKLDVGGMNMEQFNQRYSTIISARDLLKIASKRPEMGLVGRLTSTAVGGVLGDTIGGPLGTAIGILLGEKAGTMLAGTTARSSLGSIINKAGNLNIPTQIGALKAPLEAGVISQRTTQQ